MLIPGHKTSILTSQGKAKGGVGAGGGRLPLCDAQRLADLAFFPAEMIRNQASDT